MKLITYSPLQTLNKAYRKEKISRERFNHFREHLKTLFHKINEEESEEHLKYPLRDFFKSTFYSQNEINTKGKTDLGIFLDGTDKSKLGVIIEVKKPSNTADMITQTDINKKAMHEAILYYLRERIEENNNDIKHIIITNLYEWFVFDAHDFERLFYKSNLNKEYVKWKTGQKTSANTPLFYTEIARPFLADCEKEISATWFDLRDYQKALTSEKKDDERKLTALYKIISDVTLLKEPFANDSNSLDRKFYNELLHIIGLEEVKEGSKKTIKRKANPDHGSLLENTISTLESSEKLHRIENRERYGEKAQEQLFNVSLELVITWINRILFLKLLEGQLVKYHQGNLDFKFLSPKFIADFDELNELFFEVLAKRENERKDYINAKFRNIPYLNSSLFELKQGSLEDNTILVSNLKDRFKLPVYSKTVLSENGKKLTGELSTLKYLLDFIDAYDFSSEGAEEIQEENKSLINASVLGLIFEKINGYKDGSFFTPGFITMYMCRETIRRAVLQKFAEAKGWNCETIEQLKDKIDNRVEANEIVNSLKICDPAVGSGHFLVSALNEIIALKSELDILLYRSNGNRVRNYRVEVVNDELVITDKETEEIFEYHLNEKGKPIDYLQDLQETLFHEKQTIIENCLFGVDINPNSVNICRLRLWIELLKNAYYIFPVVQTGYSPSQSGEWAAPILQTLPNIDINIKCGNSLISRFPLDADLSKALKSIKYNINTYRKCVADYKNATNKDDKRSLDILINQIKTDFKDEIHKNDPKYIRLNKVKGELWGLTNQVQIFELSKAQKEEQNKKLEKLATEQNKLEQEISEIQNNIIYRNAFEWRFEFPEVLDDSGNFLGFDVVIGNPPYIRIQDLIASQEASVNFYNSSYKTTGDGNYDLYVPFAEKAVELLMNNGRMCFIMPHKFINANYGKQLRRYIGEGKLLEKFVHFGASQVFEDASTYTGLFFISKKENVQVEYCILDDLETFRNGAIPLFMKSPSNLLTSEQWIFLDSAESNLLNKVQSWSDTLETKTDRIFQGLKTSADKIYILELLKDIGEYYEVICKENNKTYQLEKKYLFPLIKGGNSSAFNIKETDLLLLFPYFNETLIQEDKIKNEAPNTWEYLQEHRRYLESRENNSFIGQNWFAFGRNQAISVIRKPKIFTPDIAPYPRFSFDIEGQFTFTGGVAGGYGIIPKSESDYLFLLAILNSKVAFWFITKTSTQMRGGWYSFESRYIKNIPIPIPTESQKGQIDTIVAQIMKSKKEQNTETAKVNETQINQLVYEIYGLTEEEVKIIESSI